VYVLASNPEDPNQALSGSATSSEIAAVKAKLPQLTRGLQIRYQSPEDKARMKAADDSAALAATADVDPMGTCMAKVQQDFMQAHKEEMDAARKKGDNSSLLALISQMQDQANSKCMAPKN